MYTEHNHDHQIFEGMHFNMIIRTNATHRGKKRDNVEEYIRITVSSER